MKPLNILRLGLLTLIVSFLLLGPFPGCAGSFDDPPREGPPLQAEAGKLHATAVSAHLESPIDNHTNVIWCGTFQLAWKELCDLTGGKVHLTENVPDAAILNGNAFTKDNLDANSYVAVAGRLGGGIRQRIESQLKKFPAAQRPQLDPSMFHGTSTDILIYSYLFKQLRFPTPFAAPTDPLQFENKPVVCFGMEGNKPGDAKIAPEISILDYRSRDDFIVELKTDSDHLILAKLPLKDESSSAAVSPASVPATAPAPTLAGLISELQRRIAATQSVQASSDDVLRVPKMNFDVNKSYNEFVGRQLDKVGSALNYDKQIQAADQDIKFIMDEKGVVLTSESHISLDCAAEPPPPPPQHVMIFDKPFLILMFHNKAQTPYFACWVANPELLVGVAH